MVVVKKIGNFGKMTIDLDKLNRIEKELNTFYAAQVGVLGSKATGRKEVVTTITKGTIRRKPGKEESDKTNAEIGLLHEKGSKSQNIPRRSFLEIPIMERLPRIMSKIADKLLENLTTDNLKKTYQQLGLVGEDIVLKAFNTKGYGKWPDNSPATIARKGSSMPLIDSAQLRKSISSRVIKKK